MVRVANDGKEESVDYSVLHPPSAIYFGWRRQKILA